MTGRELLAHNLKLHRAIKGLSQEALADEVGMDKKSFCSFELQTRPATVDAIERLAAALQVSIADLFRPAEEHTVMSFMKAGRRPRR